MVIDRLLLGNNLDQHAKNLSLEDKQTARLLLQNQQSALSQRLLQAVEAAYAIRSEPTPGTLDPAYDMSESHFQSLFPTLVLQRPVGANLGEALEHLLDQALSHQYPKHPKFGQEIKPGKDLRQVLEVCQQAVRSTDSPRVYVEDKTVRQKLINIVNPLELGTIENTGKTHFVLENYWKNHFNKMLHQSGQQNPQVGEMRRWTDSPEDRGLPKEIQNLLILVYADQTNRSFRHTHHGGNYTPTLDDLPNELELIEQTLPDSTDWQEAITRTAGIFGHGISKLLNASNLATLTAKVKESVTKFQADCESLTDQLQLKLKVLGVADVDIAKADRVLTAKAVRNLLTNCVGKESTSLVAAMAQAKIATNGTAMGRSLESAREVLESLQTTKWGSFSKVALITGEKKADADQLIKEVCTWLKTDEHALAGGLASKLSEAVDRAIELLTPEPGPVPGPVPEPEPLNPKPAVKPVLAKLGWKEVSSGNKTRLRHDEAIATTKEISEQLEKNPKLRLTMEWTLEEQE